MPLSTLSLYETARSSRPMLVTVEKIQASSVTSGTSDWRKNAGLVRIEAQGQVIEGRRRDVRSRSACGILDRRQGVVVGDEVEALALVLQRDVLLDGAEVVAEVQLARRLHAAEDAFSLGIGGGHDSLPVVVCLSCECCGTVSRPCH